MSGRRAEDQAGTCLRCGAPLHRCPCGQSWQRCDECGYPPRTIPADTLVEGEGPGGIERRRCHCDEQDMVDWMSRFTEQRDSLLITSENKRKRRKEDKEQAS